MNKAEKLAEEYCDKNNPLFATTVFLAGWDACIQDLREGSAEFDEKAIEIHSRWYHKDCYTGTQEDIFIEGARYQHSQDQLKYQALFSAYSKLDDINIELNHRIMDLKAEIENSNKFAQDQENRIQVLEAENAEMKEYKFMYEGLCK